MTFAGYSRVDITFRGYGYILIREIFSRVVLLNILLKSNDVFGIQCVDVVFRGYGYILITRYDFFGIQRVDIVFRGYD